MFALFLCDSVDALGIPSRPEGPGSKLPASRAPHGGFSHCHYSSGLGALRLHPRLLPESELNTGSSACSEARASEQDVLLPRGDGLHTARCSPPTSKTSHGLHSQAPGRLHAENGRTCTRYEQSARNNGFARAPSHVTLSQSKGKFAKTRAVRGTLIRRVVINSAKPSLKE